MKDGFFRVAAATPKIVVADPIHNREEVCKQIELCEKQGASLVVFPELVLSAYTCNELFLQSTLLRSVKEELKEVVKFTLGKEILVFLGLPMEYKGKLYNVAAAISNGKLLGMIPKVHLPNYSEFYEMRYFVSGHKEVVWMDWDGEQVPFGTNLLFQCSDIPELIVAAEICEDVWVPSPPSIAHALAGATVIVNCSASDEIVGKERYRKDLITGQSARLYCGYIYTNAGEGESTQDLVFGGHNIIAENGTCLAESSRFQPEMIFADMDIERIVSERRKATTYPVADDTGYVTVPFTLNTKMMEEKQDASLLRFIDPRPFVPSNPLERSKRCEEIFTIQAMGLKKRLEHTGMKHAVIGISGGLDSTLALLVTARAFDLCQIPRNQIHAITMPGFGTTDRTYHNACLMTQKLGASLQEISITKAVLQHFEDIGHDVNVHDVTYENGQARERTQLLMDISNQVGGLVIGTGDMSELALGWATYNGDHMSMYGVNVSIPKTLVRHLVAYYADTCEDQKLKEVLLDVLDTPVSPELLPPKDGEIAQKTEDLVGPYELHDFFLYYVMRFGYMPSKIYRMAIKAFHGEYEPAVIEKWIKIFYSRFFTQQFKRSCLPDGPKVGTVAVSPRGDLRMPSDASRRIWLADLERINL